MYPTKTKKVFNVRKSQNLCLFRERKSICLLLLKLDALLKSWYRKSWKGTINAKLYKWCVTIKCYTFDAYDATYDDLLALYTWCIWCYIWWPFSFG